MAKQKRFDDDILLFALLFFIIHKNEIEVLWLNEYCDARDGDFHELNSWYFIGIL